MPRWPEAPPGDLDDAAKRLWRRTIAEMKGQATWQAGDLELLERYVRAVATARAARGRIAAREAAKSGSGFVTRGSQGQLVQHPDVKTAREADRDANDYAQDLLITPRARKQYEIKPQKGSGRLGAILAAGAAEHGGAD